MIPAEWAYLQMMWYVTQGRMAEARERGASTLELAIIAAALGFAALAVAGIIARKVRSKGREISGY